MLTIGDRFPQFKLKAVVGLDKGKEFADVTDKDHPGKWRVVFFWPKDFTFICPTEIAEFGRRNRDFQDRDAQVLGASVDGEYPAVSSHRSCCVTGAYFTRNPAARSTNGNTLKLPSPPTFQSRHARMIGNATSSS